MLRVASRAQGVAPLVVAASGGVSLSTSARRTFVPYHPKADGGFEDVDRTVGTKAAGSGRGMGGGVSDWRASVGDVELPKKTQAALKERQERKEQNARRVAESNVRAKVVDGDGLIRQAAWNYERSPTAKRAKRDFFNSRRMWMWLLPGGMSLGFAVMPYFAHQHSEMLRVSPDPYGEAPKIAKHEAEAAEAREAERVVVSDKAAAGSWALQAEYEAMEKAIFAFIDQEYEDLGFVARDEVEVTVRPGAFTQYGVVTRDGTNAMADALALTKDDVFVDIGSGIGNVVLQVIAVTPCKHGVGLELLPSRFQTGVKAGEQARSLFPGTFSADVKLSWIEGDAVDKMGALADERPTVIFTHSWMFDDELMRRLTKGWLSIDSVRTIVTSRPLMPEAAGDADCLAGWEHSETSFGADWNDASPFHVYTRRAAAGATSAPTATAGSA